jgi:predicted dehydrogenase
VKQLVQVLKDGAIRLEDVPVPSPGAGQLLVRNVASVISAGTERMKVETGKLGLLGKARARPDQVRKVLEVVRQQGLRAAIEKVQSRLERYSPLGYSCAGRVEVVAPDVEEFRPGDDVACAGQDIANHAEMVCVPERLAVRVPPGVPLEHAAFATIGAIALQSLRQARLELGETVGVIGLGLLGQLVMQLARAAGARVLGVDIDPGRVELAARLGATYARVRRSPDLSDAALRLSDGHGLDVIVVTASSESNDPVELAVALARDRARVVFLGNTRIDLPWNDYYRKELSVLFSRSYGAGRYDAIYEEHGVDYPIGYARWTIQRNMRAFLDQIAAGRLSLDPLLTHRVPFADAPRAYDLLTSADGNALAIGLTYAGPAPATEVKRSPPGPAQSGKVRVGLVGAGNFAQSVLLPPLARLPQVAFSAVATRSGTTASAVATRFGFATAVGDASQVCRSDDVDLVMVATRHGSHSRYTVDALDAGKWVYVEKPLALDETQLESVLEAVRRTGRAPVVGFNRRFAPLVGGLRDFCRDTQGPFELVYRINAGALPRDHWYYDAVDGGGRIVGEACHFVDLLRFLVDAPIRTVSARTVRGNDGRTRSDNATIVLEFADGSIGTVHYFADGDPRVEKEWLEVFGRGNTAVLENFRRLEIWRGERVERRRAPADKGHAAEMQAVVRWACGEGPVPVPFGQAVEATRATFGAVRSAAEGGTVRPVEGWNDGAG